MKRESSFAREGTFSETTLLIGVVMKGVQSGPRVGEDRVGDGAPGDVAVGEAVGTVDGKFGGETPDLGMWCDLRWSRRGVLM